MSALLAAQSQSSAGSATTAPIGRSEALKHLFSHFDTNGDGQISKSEFESALGAGGTNTAQADDVFSKLDKDDSPRRRRRPAPRPRPTMSSSG
jgi:Ca2+-binding EF-hand superfamily protein